MVASQFVNLTYNSMKGPVVVSASSDIATGKNHVFCKGAFSHTIQGIALTLPRPLFIPSNFADPSDRLV